MEAKLTDACGEHDHINATQEGNAEQRHLKASKSYFILLIEDYPLKTQAALFEIEIYWTVRSKITGVPAVGF